MTFSRTLVLAICLATASGHSARAQSPFLLRDPAVSRTQIAFTYGGDLWIAKRDGSDIRRLTSAGYEAMPVFSPDGSQIAFSGDYDGGHGIYIVATGGGEPRRLTYHPADVAVVGWTPDGTHLLFTSKRAAYARGVIELYSIPAEGGFATRMPLGRVSEGALSPDATRLAYVPGMPEQSTWKHYRGGATTHIQIINLADSRIEDAIPRENSNDSHPMWIGDVIYFLSDRAGSVTLFAYDLKTREVRGQIVNNEGFDIKSASASSDAIAYEQFGSLHLLDLKPGTNRTLDIKPTADFAEVRPHFQKIEPKRIRTVAISPDGARAVFGVRGEILTIARQNGDIRNLTNTTAAVERDPAWAPDGRSIAYFSDESGEYALHIRALGGPGYVRKISLGDPPSSYAAPTWSPDSTKIAYTDNHLNYWYVDLGKKTPVRVDTDLYTDLVHGMEMTWSPDSRWIAYTKELRSHMHAVFIYSLIEAKSYQLTDGMSDTLYVAFDKSGKYLYFTASTDVGLSNSWFDMSGQLRAVTRGVYAIILPKDVPSPLAPNGNDETANPKTTRGAAAAIDGRPLAVRVDLEEINQRIVTLPIPAANYYGLIAGKPGILFLVEGPPINSFPSAAADAVVRTKIRNFDLQTRNTNQILGDVTCFIGGDRLVSSFHLSSSGDSMSYNRNGEWFIATVEKPAGVPSQTALENPLNLDSAEIYVDPRAEWRHMYSQVWRDERDFFYDPHLHGLDLEKVKQKYAPFLENVVARNDLNYLFNEMLGNLTVGHLVAWGGDRPRAKRLETGFLGADFAVANGRYRFARIYSGDLWNPQGQGPLTQPGLNVHEGDYLLKVDDRDVFPTADVYSYLETNGKQLVLTIGPKADGSGSRRITVVPVADETSLRNYAWIEGNRHRVDELTGGRVAYIYLPDTGERGYSSFNRYYFAQVGKEAVVIDGRDNGGGDVADYMIDHLRRPLLSYWHMRDGSDITTPQEAIFGPKVMIINEWTASGGDALAWLFRKAAIGPLIGKRTWGALVGFHVLPGDLLDGGGVSAPNLAFYNPDGTWDIENHGVSPDIELEEDPRAEREGHDPQLERAVAVILDLLNKSPSTSSPRHPPFPSYPQDGVQ